MFSKTIKAFTLLELIISMILSLIVLLIAVLAFEMFSKQYINYKKNNDTIINLYELEGLLTNDFEFSQKIEWIKDNDIVFTMANNKTVNYQLQDTCIIRTIDDDPDTFYVKINTIDKNFPDLEVNNKIIDELKIGINVLNEEYTLYLRKEYGTLCFDDKK